MTQLELFTEDLQPVRTESHLTSRQWRLHGLLLGSGKKRLERKEMLERMDDDYGYTAELLDNPKREFGNLSSLRELSDDLDALARDETIQHVLVGGKYATSTMEAEKYLLKQKISALKTLKKVSIQNTKLAHDGQMRLQFNKERDYWESILKLNEIELEEMGGAK